MPHNPERYLSLIRVEHPNDYVYFFQLNDQGTGILRVEYEKRQKAWQITDIQSGPEGQGIGQALIFMMKQTLGQQQKIMCDIEEPETLQQIHASGLDLQATQQPFLLIDRPILQSLKLVRVFEGGGLKTDYCVLEWIPLELSDVSCWFFPSF